MQNVIVSETKIPRSSLKFWNILIQVSDGRMCTAARRVGCKRRWLCVLYCNVQIFSSHRQWTKQGNIKAPRFMLTSKLFQDAKKKNCWGLVDGLHITLEIWGYLQNFQLFFYSFFIHTFLFYVNLQFYFTTPKSLATKCITNPQRDGYQDFFLSVLSICL